MFISLSKGRPAWLISHDADVVFSLGAPDEDKPHHTVSSFEFFSTHREATADELEEHAPPHAKLRLPNAPTSARQPEQGGRGGGTAAGSRKGAGADKPRPAPAGVGRGEPHGE